MTTGSDRTESNRNYERIIDGSSIGNGPDDLVSTLYHALRAARRRHVIELVIHTPDSNLDIRDLARAIAAHEQEISFDQATGAPYRNVYTALSQTHLPTLAEANILRYDSQRQTVSPGANLLIAGFLVMITHPTVQLFHEGTGDQENIQNQNLQSPIEQMDTARQFNRDSNTTRD